MEALQASRDWLEMSPSLCSQVEAYQEAKKIVKGLKVTNDVAERGVAMITEYATLITSDKEERQKLLQVAEYHRGKFPKQTKSELNTQ